MAWYPNAHHNPLQGVAHTPHTPIRLTLHTAVSHARNLYQHGPGRGGTFAHFYVAEDGTVYQYQDTTYKAAADLHGNNGTISVETWDGGREQPWTNAQVASLGALFAWICTVHPTVPDRIATPNDTRGLAWHRLGIRGHFRPFNPIDRTTWSGKESGARWSNAIGKLCPWDTRIRQIDDVYNASKTKGTEMTPEEHNLLQAVYDMIHVPDYGFGYPQATHNALGDVIARVSALQASVDALATAQGVTGLTETINSAVENALKDVQITLTNKESQ